jgi:hypothetical protein
VTPDNFGRNPVFVDFLHQFIAVHAPASPEIQAAASEQRTGWIYIIDRRTPTPEGRVPPEDILGGFEVSQGRIVPASYRANPAHRILSSSGFFRLGPELEALLIEELTTRSTSRQSAT